MRRAFALLLGLLALSSRVSAQCLAVEEARLVAPDVQPGDEFGVAVAIDGPWLAVGAKEDEVVHPNAGSVRMYALTADGWVSQQYLLSPTDFNGDRFGRAVDLDGERMIVGATGYDLYGTNAGAGIVFQRSGGQWTIERTLGTASLLDEGDLLGSAVAISGETVLLAAEGHDFPSAPGAGAVHVYTRGDGSWPLEAELHATPLVPGMKFGASVDLQADLAVVGAPNEVVGPGWGHGAVYVFERSAGQWQQVARLQASVLQSGAFFGTAVALSGDTLLVGAPGSHEATLSGGAAYVFEKSGGGWIERQKIADPGAPRNAGLGARLALHGDAALLASPSLYQAPGHAALFERRAGQFELAWTVTGSEAGYGDYFGAAAALSDGRAVVGARQDGVGGAAYVYTLRCDEVGSAYCYGDGSGASCPCGNAGAPGRGCANGSSSEGAQLAAAGSAAVGADTVLLAAQGLPPLQPGLLFQGDGAVNGGAGAPFGDGLRCAGGHVVRLEVVTSGAGGAAVSSVPLAQTGGVQPGDLKRYQLWYRDPAGSPCGALFNLTNGLELAWS